MTPSLDHFPFARPHLHGVCAKAARLHPSSLGRAATQSTFDHVQHRSSGTALGLRWGMYRTTCAVGTKDLESEARALAAKIKAKKKAGLMLALSSADPIEYPED